MTRPLQGFVSLGIFGLALSLPLALMVVYPPARRALTRALRWSEAWPAVIGLVLVAVGAWSIYFGVAVDPGQRVTATPGAAGAA